MKSTEQGRLAEAAAAASLERKGFKIIDRNWRTRVCEIDIIAAKQSVIYFVEVKYRKTDSQGSGLDYITPRKLSQMRYAARIWIGQNDWAGDYRLAAMEVEETPPRAGDLVQVN